MSQLFNMIDNQVQILLRLLIEDDTGNIQYGPWIKGPKYIRPILSIVTTLVYLAIIVWVGQYLWNQGLVPAMPRIFAPIYTYRQLLLTLLALMMLT